LKTTFPIDSTDHRSSIGLSVVEANLSQNRRALNALAPYWKKEEELALIPEETSPSTRQNRGFQTDNFLRVSERC
jgi:hypothetical protein